MKRMIVAFVAALVIACGGDGSDPPALNPPFSDPSGLNPAFSGTWSGTSTIAPVQVGHESYSYLSRIAVAVSGQTATVAQLCPTGEGTITMSGSGNESSWEGTLVCNPVSLGGCSASALVLGTMTARLDDNGTLTAKGRAVWRGCDSDVPVDYSFVGSK